MLQAVEGLRMQSGSEKHARQDGTVLLASMLQNTTIWNSLNGLGMLDALGEIC